MGYSQRVYQIDREMTLARAPYTIQVWDFFLCAEFLNKNNHLLRYNVKTMILYLQEPKFCILHL